MDKYVCCVNEQIFKDQYCQNDVYDIKDSFTAFLERYLWKKILGRERTRQEHCAHKDSLREIVACTGNNQRSYHHRQHPIEYGNKRSHIAYEDMKTLPIITAKHRPNAQYLGFGA